MSCLLLHLWRWVMVRVSEGGSRHVPVSLACDGTMCACACLSEDVECLPCSVRAVWPAFRVRVGSRVCRLWCLCGVVRVWLGLGRGGCRVRDGPSVACPLGWAFNLSVCLSVCLSVLFVSLIP